MAGRPAGHAAVPRKQPAEPLPNPPLQAGEGVTANLDAGSDMNRLIQIRSYQLKPDAQTPFHAAFVDRCLSGVEG